MPTVDNVLLPSAKVRAYFGNVSDMWIDRRLKDDPAFPRPIYIAKRRFWRVIDLDQYQQSRSASAVV